jgi:murein DD-endopeptidase MepM/ murein hydrolase activator NlpD
VREQILALVASLLMALHTAAPGAGTSASGPVERAFPVRAHTSYAAAHHDYPATDVFAACGSVAVSPVDGTVLELSRRDRWDPTTDRGGERGGVFVSVAGDDGVRYYLSHFARLVPGLRAGDRLRAGERIARVGHTGSARGTPCHVHVGLSPVCRGTGEWRIRRGVVSPYPFLRSWEDGGDRSPRAAVGAWRQRHGCP